MSIVVKGGGVDEDEAAGAASGAAPFPRRVLYWGSTFAQWALPFVQKEKPTLTPSGDKDRWVSVS